MRALCVRVLKFMLKRKRNFILLWCLFCVVVIFTKRVFRVYLRSSDDEFTNVRLCPACYGTDLCPMFYHDDVTLLGRDKLKYLQFINPKNVFSGKMQHDRVMLKKLAHDWELNEGDLLLCKAAKLEETCMVGDALRLVIRNSVNMNRKINFTSILSAVKSRTDVARCPSERLLSYIFNKTNTRNIEIVNSESLYFEKVGEMIYSLFVNPEAVLLQAFSQNEGWPFPHYKGSCGRVIVEEYVGKSLAYFENASWEQRLDISYQLLQISQLLTENSLGFALYLTDVNMDNFAVRADGTVLLIDVENVVIVDRWKIAEGKKGPWNRMHQNNGEFCKDCISFSFEDLCSYDISDHNYYSICKGLLVPGAYCSSKGFLHDIPPNVEKRTNLSALLRECADPVSNLGRFIIIPKILQVMKSLL